ncbi:MAG TPA: sigma-70 family RNA polymerase sigma factor [Kofleriaceae bacterium]
MTIDFEEHRSHLRGVAYRLLGSLSEADDAVQEVWLRLDRAEPSDIANPRGWLTTVVSRICLDMLRTRTSRREEPLDRSADRPAGTDAAQELMLADSVGRALLVVLDKLDPAERIAFVLHDLFGMPFDEIATIVSRSSDATRQLASRARRRVQGSRPPDVVLASQRHVVESFVTALRSGNVQGLIAILDPDVVVRFVDDTQQVPDIHGAEVAANHWAKGATAFAQFADLFTLALVDGSVGLVMAPKGRPVRVLRFTFENDLIARADIIADRAQLDALDIAAIESLPA